MRRAHSSTVIIELFLQGFALKVYMIMFVF
jgi:hypothetical protein